MASEIHMPVPVCLIENTPEKGLVVQPEALRVLSKVTQPVVVVAITGPYRTGKSYLMNRLARQRKGFSLGSSVQSHTKGIWMWCVPHPRRPGHALLLLDTEGLGDVGKGDTRNDTWIFTLAVLLSSTLIYNSKGTIDQQAMEQLHYVLKLSERVQLKAGPKEGELKDSEKFVSFFPTFVWAVRDFTLQLEVDGKEISEDEYLENALKLKAGEGMVLCCWRGPAPAPAAFPRAKLPTETVGELLELHAQCEREALELFMARAFKDDIWEFQAELIHQVEAVKEKFFRDNEQASWDKCKAALRDLSQDMERQICEGAYSVPGGYELFRGDEQAVVEKYRELPGKGVKADAVLQEFLQSHEALAKSILNTDRSLTEKERELKSTLWA
ncbi:guanylate-binding protein 1-like, partial [Egretta garzetta]|uniref:guanylate-binding protein 1-like n=1 Tax=Egretta garzetta TaxID=188379 RepID=UPI00163B7E1C